MVTNDDDGPIAFFKAQQNAFARTISARRGHPDFIRELAARAFDSFNGNVSIQTEGQPALACEEGCAACCTLRVVATASEVLLIAHYIVSTRAAYAKIAVDLAQRIAEEAAITDELDERRRMALRRRCPFIEDGLCLIYLVRYAASTGAKPRSERHALRLA